MKLPVRCAKRARTRARTPDTHLFIHFSAADWECLFRAGWLSKALRLYQKHTFHDGFAQTHIPANTNTHAWYVCLENWILWDSNVFIFGIAVINFRAQKYILSKSRQNEEERTNENKKSKSTAKRAKQKNEWKH